MPVRNPIIFPCCAVCRQPQYPELLPAHQALCTASPPGAGRPRKYPYGYRADYRPPSDHSWGGARRGKRWEWQRTTTAMRRQASGTSMPHPLGHESPIRDDLSTDVHRLSTGVCISGESDKGEMIPVAYVRALLKIDRRTMWRWQARYQISSVRRSYPDGSRSQSRYFLTADLQRLLHLVYSQPQVRYYRPPKTSK